MNILCISPFPLFPLDSGGKKYTEGFLKALSKNNRLICITSKDSQISPDNFFETLRILPANKTRYLDIFSISQILKICKTNQIDLIVVEQPFWGFPAFILKKISALPVIIHSHNVEYERWRTIGKWWWRGMWWLEKLVLGFADGVICISKEDKLLIENTLKISSKKTIVANYGIDFSTLSPENQTITQSIREKFDVGENQKLVLFFGLMSYAPNKEAFIKIKEKILPLLGKKNFKILVCGKGLDQDLQKNLPDELVYVGFVEDIQAYIHASDLIISPITTGGGVKTKVIEALAMDKTVISFATGALGIEQNACANKLIICTDDDFKHFAKLMFSADNLTQKTPPDFAFHYDWKNIAEQMEVFFKKIVK